MTIKIGSSNIAALQAKRYLDRSSSELNKVYERLSSGQRINRAADDASGMAVASTLGSDARIFGQAVRNLNDGISLLSVADNAIAELSDIVIRISELAEQAANGVYSSSQRKALDTEAQALSKEFHRIALTTKFNDINPLNGTQSQVILQAGYGTNATLETSVGGAIGTGDFSEVATVTGVFSNYMASADFNNDGYLDVARRNGFGFGIMLGYGSGSFGSTITSSTTGPATAFAYGDINNDGIWDIVGGADSSSSIYVTIGNGDGSLTEVNTAVLTHDIDHMTLEDVNGDNLDDLIISASTEGEVRVLLSDGWGRVY